MCLVWISQSHGLDMIRDQNRLDVLQTPNHCTHQFFQSWEMTHMTHGTPVNRFMDVSIWNTKSCRPCVLWVFISGWILETLCKPWDVVSFISEFGHRWHSWPFQLWRLCDNFEFIGLNTVMETWNSKLSKDWVRSDSPPKYMIRDVILGWCTKWLSFSCLVNDSFHVACSGVCGWLVPVACSLDKPGLKQTNQKHIKTKKQSLKVWAAQRG